MQRESVHTMKLKDILSCFPAQKMFENNFFILQIGSFVISWPGIQDDGGYKCVNFPVYVEIITFLKKFPLRFSL